MEVLGYVCMSCVFLISVASGFIFSPDFASLRDTVDICFDLYFLLVCLLGYTNFSHD